MLRQRGKNEIIVTRAKEGEIPFIRRIIDLAERSGTDVFPLQAIFELSREETERLMDALIQEPDSYYYWGKFWLLHIEGEIVGGCAAWIEEGGLGHGDMVVTEQIVDLFGLGSLEKAIPRLQMLKAIQIEREIGSLQLDSITIFPDYQGKGYVRFLLEEVLTRYCEEGVSKAQIQLVGGNERALRAYRKLGFEVILRKRGDEKLKQFYPGDERILMERMLRSGSYFASK